MSNDTLDECKIRTKENSAQNLDYYAQVERFFTEDPSSNLMKLRSFSLYTPRQVISDFLARYFLFQKIIETPGSIMEFGVFNGQGLLSFAHFSAIMEPNNLSRMMYDFDTFEGFQSLSEQDAKGDEELVVEGGFAVDSMERIQEAIDLFDKNRFIGHVPKIKLIKGDVTKTLDPFLEENPHVLISLLYLDMDIYEPTKHVLTRLIDRVPKGGIVAFDELNYSAFPGETLALLDTLGVGNIELKKVPFCSRISYFVR